MLLPLQLIFSMEANMYAIALPPASKPGADMAADVFDNLAEAFNAAAVYRTTQLVDVKVYEVNEMKIDNLPLVPASAEAGQ